MRPVEVDCESSLGDGNNEIPSEATFLLELDLQPVDMPIGARSTIRWGPASLLVIAPPPALTNWGSTCFLTAFTCGWFAVIFLVLALAPDISNPFVITAAILFFMTGLVLIFLIIRSWMSTTLEISNGKFRISPRFPLISKIQTRIEKREKGWRKITSTPEITHRENGLFGIATGIGFVEGVNTHLFGTNLCTLELKWLLEKIKAAINQ